MTKERAFLCHESILQASPSICNELSRPTSISHFNATIVGKDKQARVNRLFGAENCGPCRSRPMPNYQTTQLQKTPKGHFGPSIYYAPFFAIIYLRPSGHFVRSTLFPGVGGFKSYDFPIVLCPIFGVNLDAIGR